MTRTLLTLILSALILTSGCAGTGNARRISSYGDRNVVNLSPGMPEETKTYSLPEFTKVQTCTAIDIIFTPSDTQSVKVTAPKILIPYLDIRVSKGKLLCGIKDPDGSSSLTIQGELPPVYVSAPGVTEFITESSGSISIKGKIDQDKVAFVTRSSGDISAQSVIVPQLNIVVLSSGNVDVAYADCNIIDAVTSSSGDIIFNRFTAKEINAMTNSSGGIKLSGHAGNANLCSNSAGDIDASRLIDTDVTARANSSGDIIVSSRSRLISSAQNSSGDVIVR